MMNTESTDRTLQDLRDLYADVCREEAASFSDDRDPSGRIAALAMQGGAVDPALLRELSRRPELAVAYRVSRGVRDDAEQLAGALNAGRGDQMVARRHSRARAVWPMALAASLALVALFATRHGTPVVPENPTVATSEGQGELFSGSFEPRHVASAPDAGAIFGGGFDRG